MTTNTSKSNNIRYLSLIGLPLVMIALLTNYFVRQHIVYMGIGLGTGFFIGFILHYRKLGKRYINWLETNRFGGNIWSALVFGPPCFLIFILVLVSGYKELFLLPLQIFGHHLFSGLRSFYFLFLTAKVSNEGSSIECRHFSSVLLESTVFERKIYKKEE